MRRKRRLNREPRFERRGVRASRRARAVNRGLPDDAWSANSARGAQILVNYRGGIELHVPAGALFEGGLWRINTGTSNIA
jgi:hypothetical protein